MVCVGVFELIRILSPRMVFVEVNKRGNLKKILKGLFTVQCRVVPDTDLAGYPAAGYPVNNFCRIPDIRLGRITDIWRDSKYRFFFQNLFWEIFSFEENLLTFLVAISLLLYTSWKGSEIRSSHHLFNSLTGYQAGYQKGRISGRNLVQCSRLFL